MSYETVKDLVDQRMHASGIYVTTGLRTVSVRLEAFRVAELDLLGSYLGYGSRQQVMSDLLSTAIEDALLATSEALQSEPSAHADFTEERLNIIRNEGVEEGH